MKWLVLLEKKCWIWCTYLRATDWLLEISDADERLPDRAIVRCVIMIYSTLWLESTSQCLDVSSRRILETQGRLLLPMWANTLGKAYIVLFDPKSSKISMYIELDHFAESTRQQCYRWRKTWWWLRIHKKTKGVHAVLVMTERDIFQEWDYMRAYQNLLSFLMVGILSTQQSWMKLVSMCMPLVVIIWLFHYLFFRIFEYLVYHIKLVWFYYAQVWKGSLREICQEPRAGL